MAARSFMAYMVRCVSIVCSSIVNGMKVDRKASCVGPSLYKWTINKIMG
jgi:hypothetical protein